MITYYTKEGKFKFNYLYWDNIPFSNLHRLNGPAIIYSNGAKKWYKEGNLHRTNGPAIKRKKHSKEWYVNGKRHRLDGAAIVWYDGDEEWWVNGKKLNTKEVKTWIKDNNINLKNKQHQVLFMVMFG